MSNSEFIKAVHEGIDGEAHVTRGALDQLPGWTEVTEEESPEEATVQESPATETPALAKRPVADTPQG